MRRPPDQARTGLLSFITGQASAFPLQLALRLGTTKKKRQAEFSSSLPRFIRSARFSQLLA